MAYDLPGEGTRRLRIIAGLTGLGAAILLEIAVVFSHGAPYNTLWWVALGAVLLAAYLISRRLVAVLEWVIAGYRE